MRTPSRRLLLLMCAALLGVVVVVGIAVTAVAGLPGLLAYAVVAGLLVGLGVARGRTVLVPPPLPEGRSCTCCTTTHFDPVEVV